MPVNFITEISDNIPKYNIFMHNVMQMAYV